MSINEVGLNKSFINRMEDKNWDKQDLYSQIDIALKSNDVEKIDKIEANLASGLEMSKYKGYLEKNGGIDKENFNDVFLKNDFKNQHLDNRVSLVFDMVENELYSGKQKTDDDVVAWAEIFISPMIDMMKRDSEYNEASEELETIDIKKRVELLEGLANGTMNKDDVSSLYNKTKSQQKEIDALHKEMDKVESIDFRKLDWDFHLNELVKVGGKTGIIAEAFKNKLESYDLLNINSPEKAEIKSDRLLDVKA